MKLKQLLYGAAALAMLAACSDKDVAPGGDNNKGSITFKEGASYLGISLQLPVDPVSRAEGDPQYNFNNDRFEDGDKKEYRVETAALLLFASPDDDEDNAKLLGAYPITPSAAFDQPNKDNITVSFQQAVELLETPELDGYELWGLALVNYRKDHFTIYNSDSENYGKLIITPEGHPQLTAKTISEAGYAGATSFTEIRSKATKCRLINVTGSGKTESLESIFMTNAPLSKEQGTVSGAAPTGLKIQTLAWLDKSKIQKTEQKAIDNPAGCIFVERAVAKITCTSFPTSARLYYTNLPAATTGASSSGSSSTYVEIPISSVEWMIDNEEESSFIIRNAKSLDENNYPFWVYQYNSLYRFIGGVSMRDIVYDNVHGDANSSWSTSTYSSPNWYRTYWCIDPNYAPTKVVESEGEDGTTTQTTVSADKPFIDQANNYGTNGPRYKIYELQKNTAGTAFESQSECPLYCHENTFDVDHQSYVNTTRVIFKVTYGGGKDLFAVKDELSTFYYESDAKNLILKHVLGSLTLNDIVKELLAINKVKDAIGYTVDSFNTPGFIVAQKDDDSGKNLYEKGDYILSTLTFSSDFLSEANFGTLTEAQIAKANKDLQDVIDEANKKSHVVKFNNNTCYYAVYLKHFGDTYCPLPVAADGTDDWSGLTTAKVYQSNSNRYLGRYGLVRNNWYDLIIDQIGNIGKATVPKGNATTSDDNKVDKSFLSARIHVLSWARRTQSVTL